MMNAPTERWQELCAQATVELDPEKLRMLIDKITWLLDLEEMENTMPERHGYSRLA